jgi:hypothetical protein
MGILVYKLRVPEGVADSIRGMYPHIEIIALGPRNRIYEETLLLVKKKP